MSCVPSPATTALSPLWLTPDGRHAFSASWGQTLKVWDLDTGEALATFTCDAAARCCAYSEALNLILAGDADGHLHLLRLEAPKAKG